MFITFEFGGKWSQINVFNLSPLSGSLAYIPSSESVLTKPLFQNISIVQKITALWGVSKPFLF